MVSWEIENEMFAKGYKIICGVDESGRGPLAGPVFAAAVILPFGLEIFGLNDSKLLSEKKREKLYDDITLSAISYGIASADHIEIDEVNILNATYIAMNRAIEKLSMKPDISLIDGNRDKGIDSRSLCVIGGDRKSVSIAAASVLAKVSRDRFMVKMADSYPQYGFERHKGYGTRLHFDMLHELGQSEIHRKTFLKSLNKER